MEQSSQQALEDAAVEPSRPAGRSASPRAFTWWERLQIFAASWFGYLAVLLIGHTLRWEVFGYENYQATRSAGRIVTFAFWHSEIFSAIWFWRKRGIVVMVSQNFDGEYIARIIRKHGYGVARGSSSRSAARVVVGMIREARQGLDLAVTPDGPRGPRHEVKPGVVLLAKAAAAPILCFHIAPDRAWTFHKSWDRTEIPRPFSRVAIFIAPVITVPTDASDAEQERKLAEVQATLDRLVEQGFQWREGKRPSMASKEKM